MFGLAQRVLPAVALLMTSLPIAVAQAPDAVAPDVEALRNDFFELVKEIQISGGPRGDERMDLFPKPLLNWSNPERKTAAGGLFLWTLDGRPQVAFCLYPNVNQKVDLEFQSLASAPLVAERSSQTIWRPSTAGIEMLPLNGTPVPATTRLGRLRQMRQISRGFSAKIVKPGYTEISLRMLTTPLYRYPEPTPASTYVDGALFSFVQATDPEVLLLIEAIPSDGGELSWQYGLARMSMVPMEVSQGNEKVWETWWADQSVSSPYHVQQITLDSLR